MLALVISVETVCKLLREAQLHFVPGEIELENRVERTLATLPGGTMAWFPETDSGRVVLERERRVLKLLAERCTFRIPRIVYESPSGFDVREMVPGVHDPWRLYSLIQRDIALARRIGRSLGRIFGEQHTCIVFEDVSGWLPERPDWPLPLDEIRTKIPLVVVDKGLLAEIEKTLCTYEQQRSEPDDLVFAHGDLGLHNLAVDPQSLEVTGVFDYGGASWTDRHYDLRYTLFDFKREDL